MFVFLLQLAFHGLKPFPRRQDISSKQMVYLKALKEKYRWRELQKLAFAERENLVSDCTLTSLSPVP